MTGVDLPQDDESTARLRQQVLDALESWQMYRHLARRTRNTNARTLTAMAADQHRQARRLATAYFLLTGLRYWPSETLSTPAIPSFWGTLRQRHQAEQQAELSYRMAADEVTDPTLLELYQQLADGCRNRCRQLRSLLEQSCP
jgi:rubrerythrin